jgi:hypothetical protein
VSSLDRHLRRLDAHCGSGFHPDCPVCRERLAGTLVGNRMVGRRTLAGVLAGLLAVSALAPGASVAQRPGRGPNPPAAPAPADPTLDPDWQPPGPEGPSLAEPPAAAPPASDDGQGGTVDDEAGPVESEPLQETIPEPAEIEAPPPAAPAPPPAAVEQPPLPDAESPAPAPLAEPPVSPVQPATPPTAAGDLIEQPGGQAANGENRAVRIGLEPSPPATRAGGMQAEVAPATDQSPGPLPTASAGAEAPPASQSVSGPAGRIEGGTYVVQPGDSLWSIASRLLGQDASTVRIAHEVNRLWKLNRQRIATGDPDLLPAGTMLEL